ncbi:hypothetical protein KFE25_003133 [Diacronema lutheri]|uniref:Uncharacterized protein n=1 Tax=Diacronema lutheri TaxID=2081491 RepID=A0A8J6C612_DIALT|nr:hypothetical protein KFE25_003133 [Diacronema lutheri]
MAVGVRTREVALLVLCAAGLCGSWDPDRDSPERSAYAVIARSLWRRGAHAPCVPRRPLGAAAEAALARSAGFALDTQLDERTRMRHVLRERDRRAPSQAKAQRLAATGAAVGRAAALAPSTRVNVSVCEVLLADQEHPLHAMWGMAWHKMGPVCMPKRAADGEAWIAAMEAGDVCMRNWFQDTANCSADALVPNFVTDDAVGAPALLGTDYGIDARCRWWTFPPAGAPAWRMRKAVRSKGANKQRCVLAGYNVLSLYGSRPRYNLCRNLEWVVCAARGRLHKQPAARLVFDPPPRELTLEVTLPFEGDDNRYPPRYVYLVEVCALTQLCDNGAQLFELALLEPFVCRWRPGALRALVRLIEGGRRWRGHAQHP